MKKLINGIILSGVFVFFGVSCQSFSTFKEDDLELFGLRHDGDIGRFQIYSNSSSESAIFEDGKALVSQLIDDDDSIVTRTFFEDGLSLIVTDCDSLGQVVGRSYFVHGDDSQVLLTYIDEDGDGKFDLLLDFEKRKKYRLRKEEIGESEEF